MCTERRIMKGVLFILTICSFVKSTRATEGCIGTGCEQNCTDIMCGKYCKGNACAQDCNNMYCGVGCVGNSCAQECTGTLCASDCVGKDCAKGCNTPNCEQDCFHFEGETCTDETSARTITMGKDCSETDSEGNIISEHHCEMKNHPTLWQTLKETETENDQITLPSGDFQQCYHNNTHCVKTTDGLPPLICRVYARCASSGVVENNAKCTDSHQCGSCQGICEKDSECKGNLKCFLRTGTETVPGCSSSSHGADMDVPGKGYCADIPDSSGLKGGEIAAIVIGVFVLPAVVGALVWWCKKTKRGFFGSSSGSMAEPIKF